MNRESHIELPKDQGSFIQSEANIQMREEYTGQIDSDHISEAIQMTRVSPWVIMNGCKRRQRQLQWP